MTDLSLHLGSEEACLHVCVYVHANPHYLRCLSLLNTFPNVSTDTSQQPPVLQCTCPSPAMSSLHGFRQLCPLTLLFDLADLAHRLFEDGTFVWLDVEGVDVAEVGGDQLRQLLDVFALLLPSLPLTPAGGNVERLKPTLPHYSLLFKNKQTKKQYRVAAW